MKRDILKRIRTKRFWEEGNSEVVGFMVVTPVLAFFLVTVAGFVQLSMIRTKIDYAAYAACRAAAVSSTKSAALRKAKQTFMQNLQGVIDHVEIEQSDIELKTIGHNSAKLTKRKRAWAHDKTPKIISATTVMKREDNGKWVQGEYISFAAKCRIRTVSGIVNVLKPEMACASVGMVETKSAEESDIRKGNTLTLTSGIAPPR